MEGAKVYGAANQAVFDQSEASKSEAKVEKIRTDASGKAVGTEPLDPQ